MNIFDIFSKIFGSKNSRVLKRMSSYVIEANALESELESKPDDYFKELQSEILSIYKDSNNCLLYTSDAATIAKV